MTHRHNRNFGQQMQDEVSYQTQARLLQNPVIRELYQNWVRLKGGSFSNPRYLIGAAAGAVGLLVVVCGGALAVVAAWLGLR
jgi:hypothetical protein